MSFIRTIQETGTMADSIRFLVEFLPRIGTTSVVLDGIKEPSLKYSDSGKITVQDGRGERLDIALPYNPGKVNSKRLVKVGGSDRDEYLLTLKSEDVPMDKSRNDVLMMPQMKWSKRQLNGLKNFKLCCIQCDMDIIDHDNCFRLNEMPSEFWMELMDYWHCHKPQDKTSEFYSLQKNSLSPCLNEILIGDSFFQALEDTFAGRTTVVDENIAMCSNCKKPLGRRTSDRMLRIPKWQLRLKSDGVCDDVFPAESEIISILLNCNRANSTRYILLRSGNTQLYIWLFSMGIEVTLANGKSLHNCLKIFYSDVIPSNVGFKANIDEEQVDKVPLDKFVDALETTNSILPSSKQRFGTWKISYLSAAVE
ncbi:hypothetical protein ZYGR_0H02080 [Zygosaccharomyces rouxii]|uniref:ZYRO0B08800p n=2 Tax=Zygosaccharomyces rouxii TaxID=4956 RepID=C5DRI9_ZYGRC|nr:uncharacterized protein ZYRO0B08800g [Zygosaccharomyces rouxii]GAV47367.1 hypothetical protein ZYGR_0H02080 [Zygosaccharomyces rouxii]CAR26400.1 ZYRO0B08800p [Zygosaccharomyces rouxii]